MTRFALITVLLLSSAMALARDQPARTSITATPVAAARVAAVTSSGPGQAGYVHYFLITHDDGSLEYHVGVELEDQRMAWSFPNAGVIVSDFIKRGTIDANGKLFRIEHLHGIRPFAGEDRMRDLQSALPQRVAMWVDSGVAHCLTREPGGPFCLSCGDFVLRLLYPGPDPLVPALPRDFTFAATTNDLLLYLVGLHALPGTRDKLARLATLDLPATLRDDIASMIRDAEPGAPALALATPPSPRPASATGRTATAKVAGRRQQNRRL